jgi:hypothetical protein
MKTTPVLRVARPTRQLDVISRMYRAGLGFTILAVFADHAGFDGVVLGHPELPYHLEFTRHRQHDATVVASDEHLLVFYFPDRGEWAKTCLRMARAGFRSVQSSNPYWAERGQTFADADGCRVVLQNSKWPD